MKRGERRVEGSHERGPVCSAGDNLLGQVARERDIESFGERIFFEGGGRERKRRDSDLRRGFLPYTYLRLRRLAVRDVKIMPLHLGDTTAGRV